MHIIIYGLIQGAIHNFFTGAYILHHTVSIAIDGPAASGKSSVGLRIAEDLGFIFLDTGIMYRAVTLAALKKELDIENGELISQLAGQIDIEIKRPSKSDGRVNDIFLDGEDVSWQIKDAQVNDKVSQVSTYAGVRNAMTDQQRKIAQQGNIVMVGRDIGTVVLPNANYKFFLNASVEERARRRFAEDLSRGKEMKLEDILENLRSRDLLDSSRSIAPLLAADDAIIIETDRKTLDQVVEEIRNHIRLRGE
jgi:cytidylate kinase